MAIIRDTIVSNNSIDYVATLAFFCCVSCVALMLKFGGFKATLNLFSGKKTKDEKYRESGDLSVTGAYRTNRDEFYGSGRVSDPPRKIAPSMVKLPTIEHVANTPPLRSVKSTGNLHTDKEISIRGLPSVSLDPRGGDSSRETTKEVNVKKQKKKLDKQRLAQEKARQKQEAQVKAREKQEAQEQAKQEKLRRDKEKKEAQRLKKQKKRAPQPGDMSQTTSTTTTAPIQSTTNPLGQAPVRYTTNTLDSSISRSSGPPPYSDVPKEDQINASNVTFSKPIDTGSWDMISKHRQQIDRPMQTTNLKEKRMVMDLNYNFNNSLSIHDDKQNSDA